MLNGVIKMNYVRDNDNIFVSLQKGDEIFESLYRVIELEKIQSGWINGIGACEKVEIACYNSEIKDYNKKYFDQHFEIINLIGNITKSEGDSFLHLHITLSDCEYNAIGGHLFRAIITATCEIMIILNSKSINRSYNPDVGLCLWNLDN